MTGAMTVGPELSSMSTSLAELTRRIGGMAESLSGTERDNISIALFEVERSLLAAQRRLNKVVDDLG
jgi:hypothetical protein